MQRVPNERPVPADAGRTSWLPMVATIVTFVSCPVVLGVCVFSFFRDPGDESTVALTIGVSAAAFSVALGHAARAAASRGSRWSGVITAALAVDYSLIALTVLSYAAPTILFAIASWRTPPNYELTFELQATAEEPVTDATLDQFKTALSSNFKRMRVPHEFGDMNPPRVTVRMRAREGVDMSRGFESQPMTIHVVHDQSEAVLAAASQDVEVPEGWKVIGQGDARLLVQIEPLLVDGVQSAEVTLDSNNKSAVQIEFRANRRERVIKAMREHRGRRLAIVVGDQLYAAPRIEGEPRPDGAIQIGGLEPLEANDLAVGLRLGMYPTAFRVVEGHHIR